MKKIVTKIVLLCSIFLISSCAIYAPRYCSYKFTFNNNTTSMICDWYLKSIDGHNIARSSGYEFVHPFTSSNLYDVPMDTYYVYFAYNSNPQQYYYSDSFFMNGNKTYSLFGSKVYSRTLNTDTENTEQEQVFCLQDNEGNIINIHIE